MKSKSGKILLTLAAMIVIGTAFAHLSCIFLGVKCYSVQMAPQQIVESAKNGTYLAPVANIIVSSIFVTWGLYALSGAGIIRKLPLLNLVINSISILCIVRGLLPLQLWLRHPERIGDLDIYYGIGWLITGLLYLFGYLMRIKKDK